MTSSEPRAALYSLAGLQEGAREMMVVVPGMIAFGASFGTLAAQKGFTLSETLGITGIVYAGMSQFVAVQNWPAEVTLGAALTLAFVTFTINLRFVLIGASLQPWFRALPRWQAYALLAVCTDPGWLMSLRYHARGGRDFGFYLGGAIVNYVCWVAAAVPGYLLASWLSDPAAFGLDIAMPAFFVALLVPAWRGLRRGVPWLVSALVALAVYASVPGYWFIIAGAAAGSVAGGLMHERD